LGHGGFLSQIEWACLGFDFVLLGLGVGIVVGLFAIAALEMIRRKTGVRRDYESLYSLGVAFAVFVVAEVVHGSGFLVVFVVGIMIVVLDVEFCDCFLKYNKTTTKITLLFTFILFN